MSNTKPGSTAARRKKRVVWFKKEHTPRPMDAAFDRIPKVVYDVVDAEELAEAEAWLADGHGSKLLQELHRCGYQKTFLALYRKERAATKKTRR